MGRDLERVMTPTASDGLDGGQYHFTIGLGPAIFTWRWPWSYTKRLRRPSVRRSATRGTAPHPGLLPAHLEPALSGATTRPSGAARCGFTSARLANPPAEKISELAWLAGSMAQTKAVLKTSTAASARGRDAQPMAAGRAAAVPRRTDRSYRAWARRLNLVSSEKQRRLRA
eukprot:scaffold26561_cov129-Isochrysis_galbana.AAC.3